MIKFVFDDGETHIFSEEQIADYSSDHECKFGTPDFFEALADLLFEHASEDNAVTLECTGSDDWMKVRTWMVDRTEIS